MSRNICESNFYLITGFGHSGTAWLADVLNRPEDKMVCHHELKSRTVPLSGPCEVCRHEFEKGLDNHFDEYFSVIRSGLKDYTSVGDSNSWNQLIIPEVAKRQGIHRLIYLVRNGIQAVHSMFQHYEFLVFGGVFGRDPDVFSNDEFVLNNNYLRFLELTGKSHSDWEKYTRWGKFCMMWRIINGEVIEWLRGRLGPAVEIDVYRFEDLLADQDLLLNLVKKIKPDTNCSVGELRDLQAADINRKTIGDRSPSALWNSWSDEQRRVFEEICGPTMKDYGYEIPSTLIKNKESNSAWAWTYLTEKGLINILHQASPELLNYFAEREAAEGRKKEAVSLLVYLLGRWPGFMKAYRNLGKFSDGFDEEHKIEIDDILRRATETISSHNAPKIADKALQLLNAINERGENLASQNETDKAYDIFSELLNKIDALRYVLINNMAAVHIHKQNYEVADYLLDCLVKEGYQGEEVTANLNALKFLSGRKDALTHDDGVTQSCR